MKPTVIVKSILFAVIVSFALMLVSSCGTTSKMGCPGAITKAEKEVPANS